MGQHQVIIFDLFGTLADLSFKAMDQVISEMAENLPHRSNVLQLPGVHRRTE